MPLDELDLILGEEIERSESKGLTRPVLRKANQKPAKVHLSKKELRRLASGLARLLRGGVSLMRALEICGAESTRASYREVLERIEEEVRQGQGLAQAMEKLPHVFPHYFIQTVRAGELSGNLDTLLEALAWYLEREEEMKRKMAEALAYPSLVLGLGFVTLIVLLEVVMPKVASVYEGFGQGLPWITRAFLGVGRMLPWIMGGTVLMGVSGFYFLRKRMETVMAFVFEIPLLGGFLRKGLLARFASLLALELQSGIPVLQALESVGQTFVWRFLQKEVEQVSLGLREGLGLSRALEEVSWMDEGARAVILSGEESGKLPEVLAQLARETERELESQAHFFLKLLEPAMILAVGIVVAFIVFSTLLPLLEMGELVQ